MTDVAGFPAAIVRFGVFEADLRTGELRKRGRRVPLQEQPFQVLVALLERSGELVSREELRQRLWADGTFVDAERNLNTIVKRLREALDDSAETPRFIETLPRRGYRFIAPVQAADHRARVRWVHDGVASVVAGIRVSPLRVTRSSVVAVAIGAVFAAALGWAALTWRTRLATGLSIRSMAVLPLTNLTGDAKQDYFVEGLTDAIRLELARIPSLEIISATSANKYTDTRLSAPAIAQELGGVEGLIEGSVVRSGERIRVTIHLVDARRDAQVWSESFDEEVRDVLTLYGGIARAVRDRVLGHTMGSDIGTTSRPPTANAEAYDAFLQGSYARRRWQKGGCTTAVPHFERAIALDPNFAEAYAQLAYCYAFPARMGLSASEAAPKAQAAVARALKLDPGLSMAHAILGAIKRCYDFDLDGARRSFERALALNAGDVEAHHGYGELLCALGHDEQGLREIREGLRLDPLSLDHQTAFGLALRYTRHYEQAIGQLHRVLAEDPDWLPARRVLSLTYEAMNRRHEAVREHLRLLNQLLVRESAMPVVHELTAEYERGGWNAFWRRELAVATQDVRGFRVVWRRGPGSDRNAFMMATRLARLGERAHALEWLERAYEDRDHLLVFLDREPLFDDLRSEPTFQHLRRRIGLTQ